MKTVKCSNCGFTTWANAETCKKCGSKIIKRESLGLPRQASMGSINSPSLIKIISNDALTLMFGIILPVMMWVLLIAMQVFGFSFTSKHSGTVVSAGENKNWMFFLPIGFTLLGAALIAWRVSYFKNLFRHGVEVAGEIFQISFTKDRGTVAYTYNWQGKSFKGYHSVMKNFGTADLQTGDLIALVVNPQKPQQSVIKDLFS